MSSVYESIAQWGADRNITTGGSSVMQQHIKLVEERFELATAFHQRDGDKLEDSIGDQIVVLVMQAKMIDPECDLSEVFPVLHGVDEHAKCAHEFHVESFTDFGQHDVQAACYYITANLDLAYEAHTGNVARNRASLNEITVIAERLEILCDIVGFNLQACIEASYLAIKDRKGRMDNGVFIKEADNVNSGTK